MDKILIIGLGENGKRFVEYFKSGKYDIFGVCKTQKTKTLIEEKYGVKVSFDIFELIKNNDFKYIILSLPSEIQGKIGLEVQKILSKNTQIIISNPVSYDISLVNKLKEFENIYFFLDEYYGLLSKFLRKININSIKNINIVGYLRKDDFIDKRDKCLHIKNNFLGVDLAKNIFTYDINLSTNNSFSYNITFVYNKTNIEYNYSLGDKGVYLKVGDKIFYDNFCFNNTLDCIIDEKDNFNKYYNLDYLCK